MPRVCRDCGQLVIWARTEAMKRQALNPKPDPAGNVHAYERNGNWYARAVTPGKAAVYPDQLMMPHAATCTKKLATPPPVLPDNVTQIATWKAAASAHNSAQRNNRGKRRTGPVIGHRRGGGR